jgi:hypothetical protein
MSSAGRRQLVMVVIHVMLIAALAAGVVFGLRYAEEYAHGLDRYRQGPVKVVLRVKCHGGDSLLTVRPVESAGLVKDARVTYCTTEGGWTGQVVVESNGKELRLSGDDVLPEWLTQFQYVRDRLVRRAESLANAPADPAKSPDPNDWFTGQMPARIAAALGEDPFVEQVIQARENLVERQGSPGGFERQVVVAVAVRRPMAQVFIDNRGYVVDVRGIVLERRDKLIQSAGGMTVVLPQVADFAFKPEWRLVPKLKDGKRELEDVLPRNRRGERRQFRRPAEPGGVGTGAQDRAVPTVADASAGAGDDPVGLAARRAAHRAK